MKLALIPPNSMRSSILDGTINLMLPWQLRELPEAFVRTAMETSYTILDNGAAEGTPSSWNALTVLAEEFDVQELVLPDRLRDCDWSIESARQAGLMAPTQALRERGVKLMAVAQGATQAEFMKCIYAYAGMDHIDVIGIPRVINIQFGQWSRVRFLEKFADDPLLQRLEYHCLGAFYGWPSEVKELAAVPIVRSMDTSLPWVYGLRGFYVDRMPKHFPQQRPDDYFGYPVLAHQREMVQYNVRQLLRWAQAPRC